MGEGGKVSSIFPRKWGIAPPSSSILAMLRQPPRERTGRASPPGAHGGPEGRARPGFTPSSAWRLSVADPDARVPPHARPPSRDPGGARPFAGGSGAATRPFRPVRIEERNRREAAGFDRPLAIRLGLPASSQPLPASRLGHLTPSHARRVRSVASRSLPREGGGRAAPPGPTHGRHAPPAEPAPAAAPRASACSQRHRRSGAPIPPAYPSRRPRA